MIELGSTVEDIISGFTGIITGRCEYLTGCVQYIVSPNRLGAEGKRLDGEWFDEVRLNVIQGPAPAFKKKLEEREQNGGPQDVPKQRIG